MGLNTKALPWKANAGEGERGVERLSQIEITAEPSRLCWSRVFGLSGAALREASGWEQGKAKSK